jgi:hypothetical protein
MVSLVGHFITNPAALANQADGAARVVAAAMVQRLVGVVFKAAQAAVLGGLLPLEILRVAAVRAGVQREQVVVEALVEPQPLTARREQVGKAAAVQVRQPLPRFMSAALVALVQAAAAAVLHEIQPLQSAVLVVLVVLAWFVSIHGEVNDEICNY